MIKLYAKLDDYKRVKNSIDKMCENCNDSKTSGAVGVNRIDILAINVVIGFCAEMGDVERAENVLDMAINIGLTPDIFSITNLIKAFIRAGDLKGAHKVLDSMYEKYRVHPDTPIFNILIDGCAVFRDKDRAISLLGLMNAKYKLKPDLFSMNTAINACAQVGDTVGAFKLFNIMTERLNLKPDEFTFGSLINACAESSNSKASLALLKEIQRLELKSSVEIYNQAIKASSKAGDDAGSMDLFRSIQENKIDPNEITMTSLISSYARKGDFESANKLFSLMISKLKIKPNIISFNVLINAHAQAGNIEGAFQVYELMMSSDFSIEPDIVTLSSLIKACNRSNSPKLAIKYLELLNNDVRIQVIPRYRTRLIAAVERINNPSRSNKF
jgi:pentatricopeptide repeat protein